MTRTKPFQHPRRRQAATATATAACLLLAVWFAAFHPGAAAAQEPAPERGYPAPGADAAETLAEGLQKLREGLTELLEEIPRYAPPEVTEDGDIILRRLDPPGTERHAPAPERRDPPVPYEDGGSIRL